MSQASEWQARTDLLRTEADEPQTKFIKPRGKVDYTELGYEAGVKAMLDAKINYDEVDQGVACYCV